MSIEASVHLTYMTSMAPQDVHFHSACCGLQVGYMEGLDEGKAQTMQQGFDEGELALGQAPYCARLHGFRMLLALHAESCACAGWVKSECSAGAGYRSGTALGFQQGLQTRPGRHSGCACPAAEEARGIMTVLTVALNCM